MKEESMNYLDKVAFAASQDINLENYWLDKLSGQLVKSTFPRDYPSTAANEYCIEQLTFRLTDRLFSRLQGLSGASLPRLHMILASSISGLLGKYSGNQDIIVGTPIYKQEIDGEFINTVLVLRNRLTENMTFKELLLRTRETIIEADENQNFPLELLLQKLKIPYSRNEDFPLFDVVILLENIQDKRYIQHIKPNVIFSFLQTDEYLQGLVEYNASLYKKETIERMIAHLNQLFRQALFQVELKVSDIDILLESERRQLLYDFNNTAAGYPKDKTIQELFLQQAEKTPDNIAVEYEETRLTYRQLNRRTHRLARVLKSKGVGTDTIVGLMTGRSPEMVPGILGILKAGGAYLPIDLQSPANRIAFILQDSNANLLLTREHLPGKSKDMPPRLSPGKIMTMEDSELDPHWKEPADFVPAGRPADTAYIIYTSGTTGRPKGVIITQQGVVNYICWAAKSYVKEETVNFPLYTSAAFDLTVTSIFTPLITGNTVLVYSDGNSDEQKEFLIEGIVEDEKIGVVKATPSHLKLIRHKKAPVYRHEGKTNPGIKRFIVGGEDLETGLAKDIYENFNGDIEIYNEYGPTEATVGCMIYRFDPGKDHMKSVPIGFAADNMQIYLLDRHGKPVPVGITGEIYVSGDGVAAGYLNQVELTAEKFVPNPFVPGTAVNRMYRTGDLARRLGDGNILFSGRRDQQVKVRGYRIEPGEIEGHMVNYLPVRQAVVIPLEDNQGERQLAAYIVGEPPGAFWEQDLETGLRQYLEDKLPAYMIPTYFVRLEDIPLTPNGKIDRSALPAPGIKSAAQYAAPRDDIEEKLTAIWSGLLGIEKSLIGIEANFFQLGGHSLMATKLVSQIHKEFDVKIPLGKIFNTPTLRELAQYIKKMEKDRYVSLAQIEKKDYYEPSSAQKRLYFMQQMDAESTHYNVPLFLFLEGDLKLDKLETAFKELIGRHEILRTSLELIEFEPVQVIHQEVNFAIDYYDFSQGQPDRSGRQKEENHPQVEEIIKDFIKPINLFQAPLLRAGLALFGQNRYLLMVDVHHIATDGISQNILIRDFTLLFQGKKLPPLNVQYKDFAGWQNILIKSGKIKKQEEYWLNQFKGDLPSLNILTDYPRNNINDFEGNDIYFKIGKDLTDGIKRLALDTNTTLYIVLLTAFNILLFKYSSQEDIIVGLGIAGRTHADMENIIGLFVNMLAVRSHIQENKTFADFLEEVKKNTLKAYENQDYQFEELVKKLGLERAVGQNPLFDVQFTFNNVDEPAANVDEFKLPGLQLKPYQREHKILPFDLSLVGIEHDNTISMTMLYLKALFKQSTIENMVGHFVEILEQISENKNIPLKEITISHELIAGGSTVEKSHYTDFEF